MRIGLTGTFHSANRGDASIQLATILELHKQFPGCEIVLFSSHPEDDAAVYPGVHLVPTRRREPHAALIALLSSMSSGFIPTRMLPAEVCELKKLDLIIDLSGDGFTDTFGWKCPASHAAPLLCARALGIPYFLMAQTIGPFKHGTQFYCYLFEGAQSVMCRDEESYRAMSGLLKSAIVEQTADIAFLLPSLPVENLSRYSIDGPLVGVTPSNLFNVQGSTDREVLLSLLAAACNKLIEEVEAKVLIIPTVFGPGEAYDDRAAARELAARLPNGKATVCEEALEPRELKTVIGMCDLYMSVRMHGLIHALSQFVPSLAIAYAPKTHNLFRRVGISDLAVDMHRITPEQFASTAMALWNERARMRCMLEQSLQTDLLPSARRNIEILADHVQRLRDPAYRP